MAKSVPVTKKAMAAAVTKAIAANPPKIKLTSGQRRTVTASGSRSR
jgi:hypothetical protein